MKKENWQDQASSDVSFSHEYLRSSQKENCSTLSPVEEDNSGRDFEYSHHRIQEEPFTSTSRIDKYPLPPELYRSSACWDSDDEDYLGNYTYINPSLCGDEDSDDDEDSAYSSKILYKCQSNSSEGASSSSTCYPESEYTEILSESGIYSEPYKN